MESCQKTSTSSKRKTRLHSTFPGRNGYSRLRQKKSRRKESLQWIRERVCIWSARGTFTLLSWKPLGHREVRRRWWRPTARCKPEKKPLYLSKNWTYSWRTCFLKKLPQFFSVGKFCEDHWYTYHWTSGQKPHLTKNGKKIDCNVSNCVPFVVPGLLTSSSTTLTPTSSSSSSQDSVFDVGRYIENPVPERSGSTSEQLQGTPLHKPKETENTNKNERREEVQSDLLHDLPDWLQELVDEGSPLEPRWNPAPEDQDTSRSCHELPMESRAEVEPGSGKHSVYTHFPTDPNCDICLKTKITRASCRRRTGTLVPRSQNSQWRKWIAWQSSIRRRGSRFSNPVVTVLPVENKNFSGDQEEPNEVPGADEAHFPKDRNCEICQRTKITMAPYRRRIGGAVPRAENFGDLMTADHKFLVKDVNLETIIDMQSWCRTWPPNGSSRIRAQQKLLKKHKGACKSSQSRIGSLKSFTLTILWNSAKPVKISPGIIARLPHRSETNGIAERAVRRVKEDTSAVLLQSGLNENWWADSMECYCYLRNIQDLLSDGKTPYETRFGMPFNGPVIPFGATVEYHPISAKDQSGLLQFGAKVLPGIFLGYALYACGIWNRRHSGRRHWRIGGDGRIWTPRQKAQCKGSVNAAKKWKLHIPSRRWNSQNLWVRTASENHPP